jgi:hypothetical protein
MTLKELFEKQSTELTDEDILEITKHLRAARDKYVVARQEARTTGKKIKNGSGISRKSVGLVDTNIDELLGEMFPE